MHFPCDAGVRFLWVEPVRVRHVLQLPDGPAWPVLPVMGLRGICLIYPMPWLAHIAAVLRVCASF